MVAAAWQNVLHSVFFVGALLLIEHLPSLLVNVINELLNLLLFLSLNLLLDLSPLLFSLRRTEEASPTPWSMSDLVLRTVQWVVADKVHFIITIENKSTATYLLRFNLLLLPPFSFSSRTDVILVLIISIHSFLEAISGLSVTSSAHVSLNSWRTFSVTLQLVILPIWWSSRSTPLRTFDIFVTTSLFDLILALWRRRRAYIRKLAVPLTPDLSEYLISKIADCCWGKNCGGPVEGVFKPRGGCCWGRILCGSGRKGRQKSLMLWRLLYRRW